MAITVTVAEIPSQTTVHLLVSSPSDRREGSKPHRTCSHTPYVSADGEKCRKTLSMATDYPGPLLQGALPFCSALWPCGVRCRGGVTLIRAFVRKTYYPSIMTSKCAGKSGRTWPAGLKRQNGLSPLILPDQG